MRKTILAAATALTMATVPAAAQETDRNSRQQALYEELTSDQRAMFDRMTPDRQVMYFGWNDALRDYYWDLSQERQDAWWYLTNEQRIALFQMQDVQQRESMWMSVVRQVADLNAPDTSRDVQPTAYRSDRSSASARTSIRWASNAVVQDAPPAHNGEYPVCEGDRNDNCINAWAAGRRGPGVDRPLDYWPGETASSG